MKEKLRKILQSLKNFLDPLARGFIIFFCVVLGMCVGLCAYEKLCRSGFFDEYFESDSSIISASADAYSDSSFKTYNYDGANMLDYDYNYPVGITKVDNVTLDIREDGRIYVSSSLSSNGVWIPLIRIPLSIGHLFSLEDLTNRIPYTFSGSWDSDSVMEWRLCLKFYRENFSGGELGAVTSMNGPVSFVPSEALGNNYAEWQATLLYLYIGPDQILDNQVFEPMLTRGDTYIPYFPSLKRLFNVAYNEGVQDGAYYGSAGIFSGGSLNLLCTEVADLFEIYHNYDSDDLVYLSGGIDLGAMAKTIEAGNGDEWNKTHIEFSFASPVPLSSFSSFRGVGRSTSFYNDLILTDTNDNFYTLPWNDKGDDGGYSLNFDMITSEQLNDNILITSFYTQLGGGVDGLDVSYYDKSNSYTYGYTDGYNDGLDKGQDKGYSNGYTAGLKDGETLGISIGKNSVSGDNLTNAVKGFAFSLFDAPISAFLNVFNLSYDGFNLGALVAFIFTIVVVVGVLKVVL